MSGGHEEDCCTHYVCPICGEELILVRFYGFTKLYYKCYECSENFSLEEIEGKNGQ
ncbi:MAG: hypothetical protein IKE28_04540 [Solobacterium sp.]|nr:hypothetical protein [Solobacterium sp.]